MTKQEVARLLYESMRECCNGYVEHIPDDEPVFGATFDGDIALDALTDDVIAGLGLVCNDG